MADCLILAKSIVIDRALSRRVVARAIIRKHRQSPQAASTNTLLEFGIIITFVHSVDKKLHFYRETRSLSYVIYANID